ncbi:hypothetical protein [Novosphingobium soli]|uniref:Uncharacterized protein n=1 Tax=Novosphingobium soli TaxID=574956 RepID=A0ABV6CSL0_9SPHN
MSFTSALLYPILLLFPAAAGDLASRPEEDGASGEGHAAEEAGASPSWPALAIPADAPEAVFGLGLLPDAVPQDAWQVRIEQRMTIRISPRAAAPPPNMFVGIPGEGPAQVSERKIGKCLSISGIASVYPDRANRLLLVMRDRRVVSAELDRSCRARDFYSGFYLERSEDGRLCVDRDTLLSRSGMNCKLTRIRQLVEEEH